MSQTIDNMIYKYSPEFEDEPILHEIWDLPEEYKDLESEEIDYVEQNSDWDKEERLTTISAESEEIDYQ